MKLVNVASYQFQKNSYSATATTAAVAATPRSHIIKWQNTAAGQK